jgi:hypothetical protein
MFFIDLSSARSSSVRAIRLRCLASIERPPSSKPSSPSPIRWYRESSEDTKIFTLGNSSFQVAGAFTRGLPLQIRIDGRSRDDIACSSSLMSPRDRAMSTGIRLWPVDVMILIKCVPQLLSTIIQGKRNKTAYSMFGSFSLFLHSISSRSNTTLFLILANRGWTIPWWCFENKLSKAMVPYDFSDSQMSMIVWSISSCPRGC